MTEPEKRYTVYACPECGEELGRGNGHLHPDGVRHYGAPLLVGPLKSRDLRCVRPLRQSDREEADPS